MNPLGLIYSQDPPAMDHHCNRCSQALGPIDQKENGGWFATCFKCRETELERGRNRQLDADADKENANPRVDSSTRDVQPQPAAIPRGRGRPRKRPLEEVQERRVPVCNRCPLALGPMDQKENGGWFSMCFKCREVESERVRRRRTILPGLNRHLHSDTENANPCVDSSTRGIQPQPVVPRGRGRPRKRPLEQEPDVSSRQPQPVVPRGRGRPRKRPLEQEPDVSSHSRRLPRLPEPDVSTCPLGRPQEENERRQQEDERQQTLLEPDVSTHPPSHPHEENERGQRGEEVQQRLQHVDEGDDCPPHRPRQPDPEVSTGRPQEENERTDNSDYGDDDDDDAVFRQMAEGLICHPPT